MDCTRLHSSGKQCTIDSVAGSNGAGGADSTKMGPVAFRVRVEDESYNQIRSSDIRRGSHVHQHGRVRQRHQLQRRGRRQRQGLLPELQAESRRSVEGPGTGLHRRNRRRSHGGDRGIQHLRAAAQVGDGQVQRPHPVPGQRPGRYANWKDYTADMSDTEVYTSSCRTRMSHSRTATRSSACRTSWRPTA